MYRIMRWLEWSDSQFAFTGIAGEEAGYGRFYSSNLSLKRGFFLEAGGFDEDFLFDYEDLDCGRRLHDRGMRLLYEPAAVAREPAESGEAHRPSTHRCGRTCHDV